MALTASCVAAAVTAGGVVALLVLEWRATRRPTAAVWWTAILALVTAAVFWLVERGSANSALALGVAAPGAAIWCAVIATAGHPGALVDPPAVADTKVSPTATRSGRARARRQQGRYIRRYLALVAALVLLLVALAVAVSAGVLPWTTWP